MIWNPRLLMITNCVNLRTPIPNTDPYPTPAYNDIGTPNGTPTPNSIPVCLSQFVGHAEPDSGTRTRTD